MTVYFVPYPTDNRKTFYNSKNVCHGSSEEAWSTVTKVHSSNPSVYFDVF